MKRTFPPFRFPAAALLVCAAVLLSAGCSRDQELDSVYGRVSGAVGGSSVNGTAALAHMFTQRGDKVLSRRALTPTVADTADVIVWAPDNFSPPSTEVIDWLDDWLWAEPGRRLIYIGRDYNAEVTYWEKVIPLAPAEQRPEMQRRQNEARRRGFRPIVTGRDSCDWFDIDRVGSRRQVRELSGSWASGIDAARVEIVLESRMIPDQGGLQETLLESQGEMLVARYRKPYWPGRNDLLLVANGSFLLNLPLVNHEHRKLAARLVDDSPSGTVVFLESGWNGPRVLDKDPEARVPTGLEQFAIWPQSIVLLHLAAAGILFCFARWPIFGRPRRGLQPPQSDFGQHVQALGEMLEQTGNRDYALRRHRQYQQTLRNESTY